MRYLYIGYNDWLSLKKWGQSVKVRNLPYPFLRGQPLKQRCATATVSRILFIIQQLNKEITNNKFSLHSESSDQIIISSWQGLLLNSVTPTVRYFNRFVVWISYRSEICFQFSVQMSRKHSAILTTIYYKSQPVRPGLNVAFYMRRIKY